MSGQTYTFLPKIGAVYTGNIEDEEIGFQNEYLASFDPVEKQVEFKAGNKIDAEYLQAALDGVNKTYYKLTDIKPELSAQRKIELKVKNLKRKNRCRYDGSLNREMSQLYQEYQAVVNGDNTNQLTIVQFVNEIVGKLEQPSFITTAFRHIGLDKLRGKIPEMGWPAVNIQVQRLSEPEINYTEYGQNEFRIFRNDVHTYSSREDRLEATIDPFTTSIAQGQIQMQRARELLALKESSNLIKDAVFGDLPDFTATGTEGVPHATNDAPKEFVNVYLGHFNKFFNYIKYWIFNPLDYRDYLSNWFSFAYAQQNAPKGFGVVPFKGMEEYGGVAIISPYVPRKFVYALTNEGAYELDGPYVVDSEYDAKKFADYNIIHDFIGYLIMNPKRFGEKLLIAGGTPGTEITTNKQVYDLLKPPTDLVEKNATA
ncbi:hypothetical protein LCGC14_0372820 [marine sediment metagenome]|uniref:Uncharacterized protein n=1 Tax=marine sediment metagenome TaxID=412755 RepID=A0A0F9VRZ0_9ZZZZ